MRMKLIIPIVTMIKGLVGRSNQNDKARPNA